MDVGAGVRLVTVGVSVALLLACSEAERDPGLEFPWPAGGSGGGLASGGSAAGGVPEPTGCVTDVLPSPLPSALEGDITAQVMSDGCGKSYECEPVKRTLLTEGDKPPDCADKLDRKPRCGHWSVPRDFFVTLPPNYDSNKPYGLLLHGDGCGSTGASSYLGLYLNVPGGLIDVGLAPGLSFTNDSYRTVCFDTQEGDDSIDWVFYERLYDKLNAELCFDRRRVFVAGGSNSFPNELACKYAGDALRPVRAVIAESGGFPAAPQSPTCSQSPLAGFWLHGINDMELPFDNAKRAISRAMTLSQCAGGDYDHAQLENFPIGGGVGADICKHIVGCDPLYPLVVCPMLMPQKSYATTSGPGSRTFVSLFVVPPLSPTP